MPAPSPAISNFNRPFDALLQLQDDAAAITSSGSGTVGGSAVIRDLGDGVVFGDMVIDINSIDVSSTDESYIVQLQGSNSATFANTIVILVMQYFGAVTPGTPAIWGAAGDKESAASAITNTKRFQVPFWNVKYGLAFRYVRARFVLGGTTPSLDAEVYLSLARN